MPNITRPEAVGQDRYAALLRTELERCVVRLQELGAQRIVLFGSYAQGRADSFTDLDLFVVLDSPLPLAERLTWLYKELAPRVACDSLAYTPKEWQIMRTRPFVRDALHQGVVLHEEERS